MIERLMVLVTILVIVGMALGYEVCRFGTLNILKRVIDSRFSSTEGEIETYEFLTSVGKTVRIGENCLVPISEFHVQVEYVVNGETYVTRNVSPWSFVSSSDYVASISRKFEQCVENNVPVTVLYNPENPSVALLTSEIGSRAWVEFGIALILVGSVVPVYLWFAAAGEGIAVVAAAQYVLFGCAVGVASGALLLARVVWKLQGQRAGVG